jgi:site-specific recombinase XerD
MSEATTGLTLLDTRDQFINYLRQKGRANATILAYGKDIEQLAEFLGTQNKSQVKDVITADIENFKIYLKNDKYTAKSVSRKVNSIKSLFRFLKSQSLVVDNPAQQVTHPKYEISPPRVLSRMEYRALRDACRDDIRLSAIIELLLQTGMRIGELASLVIEDVDFSKKVVTIKPYQSHDGRTIPLTDAAIHSIEEYLKVRPKTKESTLFITKTGNSFLVRNIRTAIDRFYKLAGIEDAKVNDLRHTFIIQQLQAGVPLTYISKIVGHKRISTTEKYLKLIEIKSEKDAVKIEEL